MKHFIQYERIEFIKISNILVTCLKWSEDNFGKKRVLDFLEVLVPFTKLNRNGRLVECWKLRWGSWEGYSVLPDRSQPGFICLFSFCVNPDMFSRVFWTHQPGTFQCKMLCQVLPTSSGFSICLSEQYRSLSTRWSFSRCNTRVLYAHLSLVRGTCNSFLRLPEALQCGNVPWICYPLKESVQEKGLKWMMCFLETCCLLTH